LIVETGVVLARVRASGVALSMRKIGRWVAVAMSTAALMVMTLDTRREWNRS
jgi:hypothetical protein